MGKIFLSYAHADQVAVEKLYQQLSTAGFNPWMDCKDILPGENWDASIKNAIHTSDIFIFFLSPNSVDRRGYLQKEIKIALNNWEEKLDNDIYLIPAKLAECKVPEAVSKFQWVDLFRKDGPERLIAALTEGLKRLGEQSPQKIIQEKKHELYQPDFQNREEELDELFNNLTKPAGGTHFWQILAPPQMGKSWFLSHLADDLQANTQQDWEIRRVDIRSANSLALRSDPAALLTAFFNLKVASPITDNKIMEIGRRISASEKYWLLLLDNAELISDVAATGLRAALGQINAHLRGHQRARLAFVAATRRHFAAWLKVLPEAPRFKSRPLSPFTTNVVYAALEQMAAQDGINNGPQWLDETARVLQRVTEGLPALLVRYLDWIKTQAYLFTLAELESTAVFERLARPYIEETILSVDSLLPGENDANRIQPQCEALRDALVGLCLRRRFITRYIDDMVQTNANLLVNMGHLAWGTNDLHTALKRTYITEPVPNDLWTVFYPAIRRLLFRYYYDTPAKQAEAHQQASSFYQSRWREWDGTDRAIVLLEHFWHQVEYLRLSAQPGLSQTIQQFAGALFTEGRISALYTPEEIAEIIATRMAEDEEFQSALHQIAPQLSEQISRVLSV